jgi:hypothetical protein
MLDGGDRCRRWTRIFPCISAAIRIAS